MEHSATRPSAYPANALPPGTRLGEFEVLDLLGVGGFGIVYLAMDHALEREVAVKEYMPAMLAGRTETLHVSLRSQSDAETFALGRSSFVNEAKLLARFDHPSLVKVYRFWEANDTAYMAMPLYRGQTLKAVCAAMPQPPDEAWLRGLLAPLLSALETLHAAAVFHRDIAPDNILIEPNGRPVLLDFGAARRVIGDKSQNLTAILKPQYAPIEQYADVAGARQGPWTDLYALGATLHFALVGVPPTPATARSLFDDLQPLSQRGLAGCSEHFLHAIDWMLAMRPGDRPQSVAALRQVLEGGAEPPAPVPLPPAPPPSWQSTVVQASQRTVAPVQADDDATVVERPAAAPVMAPPVAPVPPLPVPPLPAPSPPADWAGDRGARRLGPALAALALAGAAAAWWFWPGRSVPQPAPAPPLAASVPGSMPAASANPGAGSAAVATPRAPGLAGGVVARGGNPVIADSPKQPATARPSGPAAVPVAPPPRLPEPLPAAPAVPAPVASVPAGVPPSATGVASAARPAAVAAPPLSDDPSAICGKRVLLAQFVCMERECRSDALRDHPACRTWYRQNPNAQQP